MGGDVSGIIFGGQIGYNWQINQIVFGIETDLHYSGQDDIVTTAGGTVSNELDWFGTFRGRIGLAVWDRWLPYFTGGLAYGGRTIKIAGVSADNTALGWAIGVGVDYAITPQWSARLEYLHISLEDFSATFPASARSTRAGSTTTSSAARSTTASCRTDRGDIRHHQGPAWRRPFCFLWVGKGANSLLILYTA